jgi:hypothetical protein
MTKDEAQRAAKEAGELIGAVIKVAKNLNLSLAQTRKAVPPA